MKKYEMKHARDSMKHAGNNAKRAGDNIKHTQRQKKKRKITIKKKTVFITLGIIVGVAVIVLGALNYQLIYGFIISKINTLTGRTSEKSVEVNEEAASEAENTEIDDNSSTDSQEEDSSDEQAGDDEDASKTAPTIELVIDEGPLYSKGDDICYYRVRAIVTGEPSPEVSFSKDDSQGSLGPDKAQINLKRDSKSYMLTATASNTEGEDTDTMALVWSCNRSPDIKGISLSTDTLYAGKQYEVSVDVSDLDGDELSYAWSVAGGSIVDTAVNPVKWNTPTTPGDYKITIIVNDGKGNTSESSIAAYVGEVTVPEDGGDEQPQSSSLNLPGKEAEGGYIEEKGVTSNGDNIYAGDSANDNPCSGFISFDISGIGRRIVESASLTLGGATVLGDPSFYYMLNINVLDWGARPITQDDFKIDGIFVASYDSPNITCNVSKLKEELQKAINTGKSRFQIRVHFSGPKTDGDGQNDGWRYSQSNINLNVTVSG